MRTAGNLVGLHAVAIPIVVAADGPDSSVFAIFALRTYGTVLNFVLLFVAELDGDTVFAFDHVSDDSTRINITLELLDLIGQLRNLILKRCNVRAVVFSTSNQNTYSYQADSCKPKKHFTFHCVKH